MDLKFISLISLCALLSGAQAVKISRQNHETVGVEQGEMVKLVCTADQVVKACSFRSPSGESLFMFPSAKYEEGRIQHYGNSEFDCGLEITSVEDQDNGEWECAIVATADNGVSTTDQAVIKVTVSVPPTDVFLKIGDNQAPQEYQVKMEDHENGEMLEVQCIALQARPKPSFVWSIGSTTPLIGDTEDRIENENAETEKADYIQVLKYYPKTAHNDQELKCVVDHSGYTQSQREQAENQAQLKLNVLYKPQETDKDETFYSKVGETKSIPMKFYANPKPTRGIWQLGDTELAVGAESIDKKFKSTVLTEGAIDGEWLVTLTINNLDKKDAQAKYKLVISNAEGEAEYGFKLALGPPPPKANSSSVAIGVVVVIALVVLLLIIVAVARSKGMLCFGPKDGDDHDEEKEAFDNAEKGEAAPIVDAKGDSKPDNKSSPVKPVSEDKPKSDQEDKKSNGAHTPV